MIKLLPKRNMDKNESCEELLKEIDNNRASQLLCVKKRLVIGMFLIF